MTGPSNSGKLKPTLDSCSHVVQGKPMDILSEQNMCRELWPSLGSINLISFVSLPGLVSQNLMNKI